MVSVKKYKYCDGTHKTNTIKRTPPKKLLIYLIPI